MACCVPQSYAVRARTESEWQVDSELPYAFGFWAVALARLGHTRASVYARVCVRRSERGANGRAGPLVQSAAARGCAALSADRGSHRAAVRLLAGGDCFAHGGGGAKFVFGAAA